jgi:D-alanyl-lipoteichoic acid acyltransferase DltB (MBOAT superfamily)
MSTSAIIDLYSVQFWVAVAAACAVMAPLASGKARRIAFALVNLGFLGYFLGVDLAAVLVSLAVVCLGLRLLESGSFSRLGLALGIVLVLVLFVAYKVPDFGDRLGVQRWHPVMTTIGFSYVALRLVEVGRAVFEGRHKAPSAAALVNFLLPFHMLSAGPIQSFDHFAGQAEVAPPRGPAATLASVERITTGLFKKFVLANALQSAFLTSFQAGGPYFFLEVQVNYVWLYLDFSAYTDIAVGIGGLMGVDTPENFNRPLLARNSIDYWDRWHISLSQWIRRNVFTPIQLALVRRTAGRRTLWIASFAFAVSFLLCGLWHNIGLSWLLWGAYHAFGLICCNLYRAYLVHKLGRKGFNQYLTRPWIRAAATLLTFEFVAFSLVPVTYAGDLHELLGFD